MEIRALRPSDDRSRFSCGDPDLDAFLSKYAAQNQFRHYIGVTYVAVESRGRVVGFATVAAGHVEAEDVAATVKRRLPAYPLPILRLGRLAVDQTAQGAGVGKALLKFVFRIALRLRDEAGCVGVVVDALPAAESFYRGLGFIAMDVVEGASSARPVPTPLFLPIQEIDAAEP